MYGASIARVTQMPNANKRLYIFRGQERCQGPFLGGLILPGQGSAGGLFLIKASPCKVKQLK